MVVQNLQLLSGDRTKNLAMLSTERPPRGVLALETRAPSRAGRGGYGDVLPESRVHGGLVHVLQAEKLGAQVDLAGVSLLGRLLDFERVEPWRPRPNLVLGVVAPAASASAAAAAAAAQPAPFLRLSLGDAVAVLPRVEKPVFKKKGETNVGRGVGAPSSRRRVSRGYRRRLAH